MKLEFLDDISAGGKSPHADPNQLIGLFDFDPLQAVALMRTIRTEMVENSKELDLTSLAFIEPINCSLILKVSETNEGITTVDKKNFICGLTKEFYKEMIFLMEPFCKGLNGYQWLYDLDVPIDFLFSPGSVGSW